MPELYELDNDLRLTLANLNEAMFRQSVCLKALTDLLVDKKVIPLGELSSAIATLTQNTMEEMKNEAARGPKGVQ
jgi:hypothetical protein